MKLNYSSPITDLNGNPISDQQGEITLGAVVANALLTPPKEPLSGEESLTRFNIALRIKNGEAITVEDAALIKTLVPAIYGPLIYGRVVEALEA